MNTWAKIRKQFSVGHFSVGHFSVGHWDIFRGGTIFGGAFFSGTIFGGIIFGGTIFGGTIFGGTKPVLQQNLRKAKKGPLSIRIKRSSERDVRTYSVGGFRVILTLQ